MQAPRYFYPATVVLLAMIAASRLFASTKEATESEVGRYVPGNGRFVIDTRTGRICEIEQDSPAYTYRVSGAGWCSRPFPPEAPEEAVPTRRAP